MNVKKNYLLTVAVLTSLAACTVDDRISQKDETPIVLTTMMANDSYNVTRAGTALQGTQFGSGETFYAYFPSGVRIGSATSESTTIYTTDGNGGTTPASQPYFISGVNSCNVYAYYPYEASGKQVTNATTSFSVELDQTTDAGYKLSDLMYATVSVTKNNATPSGVLSFNHKMSKILINVIPGQGISSVSGIRIVGGCKTVALSTDGTCTPGATSDGLSATGSYITVFSGSHTSGTLSCAALIPPQTITSSFLQVVTAEGTATYSITDQTFVSGQSYEYTINVTAATIGVTTDITDWDNLYTQNLYNSGTTSLGGAESVDLGLPSGTKWANMNVGAASETDFGLYFAWGETIGYGSDPYDNHSFDWTNYTWGTSYNALIKYNTESANGTVDNKNTIELADDAARANWGGDWRMPTQAECQELMNETDHEYVTINGVAGCKLMKQTDHSVYIFLPFSGNRNNTLFSDAGSNGKYWSSSLYLGTSTYQAYCMDFNATDTQVYGLNRYYGCTVRPVR